MLIESSADAVVIWAPAKVNLFLEVIRKRPDGYHDIATLMIAVSLYDTLEFKGCDHDEVELHCDHPRLSVGPENLVCRAAALLKEKAKCSRGVIIRLTKRIPLAAGLAGGSSDAAATLHGLNQFWDLGLTQQELMNLGSEIGSDIAFFFETPAAWCTGRGEQVTALRPRQKFWFVLSCPPIGVSTPEVYKRVTVPQHPANGDEICRAIDSGNAEELGKNLHNRLQEPAKQVCPLISRLERRLHDLQPAGYLMSGSGSTVFALCRNQRESFRIANNLRYGSDEETSPSVFIVRSCV